MSKHVQEFLNCLFLPRPAAARCQYEQLKELHAANGLTLQENEPHIKPSLQTEKIEVFTNGMTLWDVMYFASDI